MNKEELFKWAEEYVRDLSQEEIRESEEYINRLPKPDMKEELINITKNCHRRAHV